MHEDAVVKDVEMLKKVVIIGNGQPSLLNQMAEVQTTLRGIRWLILAAFLAIPALEIIGHLIISEATGMRMSANQAYHESKNDPTNARVQ